MSIDLLHSKSMFNLFLNVKWLPLCGVKILRIHRPHCIEMYPLNIPPYFESHRTIQKKPLFM